MKLYEMLKMTDVLGPIGDLLDAPGGLDLNKENRIPLKLKRSPNTPWINVKRDERCCGKWGGIYFKYYNFIPSQCRKCWKVVWTGSTIRELFKIREIQKEMDLVSKCGVERRPWSGKMGKYQGFWYTPLDGGLKGARRLYAKVVHRLGREKVLLGPNVILKRGCTEFENRYSPSDKWDEFAERYNWNVQQMLCDSVFLDDPDMSVEGSLVKVSVKLAWLTFAWEHRDPTVGDYMERPPLEPLLQYQRSIHSEKDYVGDTIKGGNGTAGKTDETVGDGKVVSLIH